MSEGITAEKLKYLYDELSKQASKQKSEPQIILNGYTWLAVGQQCEIIMNENLKLNSELAEAKARAEGFKCQLLNERKDYFNEHERANELESQLAESKKTIEELVKALEIIGDYATAGDGQKYPSYEAGWHGVSDFANQVLSKHKTKGK